jgi:type I restriction enzyme, S subunit
MKGRTKFKETEIGMIPEDWDICDLSDIAEIKMGQSPPGELCTNESIGLPLLNGPTEFTNTYPNPVQFTQAGVKFAPIGSILFCVRGSTTGRMNWADREYCIGRGIASITHKKGIEYNHFIKGILDFKKEELLSIATGSTFPNISYSQLARLKIQLPPVPEQQGIANFLLALDSKIELNQQMNATLEKIGQALFKHWFIDFEFPNEKGKPYKSSSGEMVDSELGGIPKGWEVRKLGDFVYVIKGVSYTSNELKESDTALVTLKSIDRGGGLNRNGFKEYVGEYDKEQEIIDGDIVVAHTDLTQKAEVLGKPAIVRTIANYKSLVASLDLSIVRPKDNSTNKPYLFYLLMSEHFQNHAFSYSNGTTVLHLSNKAVPNFEFILPGNKIVLKFGEITEILLEKKNNNEREMDRLSEIRDSLLPKVISGQIRVPAG